MNTNKLKKYIMLAIKAGKFNQAGYIVTPLGTLYKTNYKWLVDEGYWSVTESGKIHTPRDGKNYPFGELLRDMLKDPDIHQSDSLNDKITKYRGLDIDYDYKKRINVEDIYNLVDSHESENGEIDQENVEKYFSKMLQSYQEKLMATVDSNAKLVESTI